MAPGSTADGEADQSLAAYLSELEEHQGVNRVHYSGDMIEVLYQGKIGLGHLVTERLLEYGYVVRMAAADSNTVHFESIESIVDDVDATIEIDDVLDAATASTGDVDTGKGAALTVSGALLEAGGAPATVLALLAAIEREAEA